MNFETNWEFIPFKHWWSEQLIYLSILLLCLWLAGFFKAPQMGAKVSYSFATSSVAPTSRPGATTTPIPSKTPTRTPTSTPRPVIPVPPVENTPTATPVPPPVSVQHFSDVSPTSPYYAAVEALYNAGIITGYEDGTFAHGDPSATITTRNEMAQVLYRMFVGGNTTTDGAINYLINKKFTTRSISTFDGNGPLLRGDAAMFLGRMISVSQNYQFYPKNPDGTFADSQFIAISYLEDAVGLSVGCDRFDSACYFTETLTRGEWANIMNVALSKRGNLIQ